MDEFQGIHELGANNAFTPLISFLLLLLSGFSALFAINKNLNWFACQEFQLLVQGKQLQASNWNLLWTELKGFFCFCLYNLDFFQEATIN